MMSLSKILVALALAISCTSSNAFVSKLPQGVAKPATATSTNAVEGSSSALSERRWNFNEGQSPWGLKKNAETWNGRVAQVAFVWIFLQELVTGKGVFKGIDEGNWFFLLNLGLFGVGVVGLTGWLALQGDDDYTLR